MSSRTEVTRVEIDSLSTFEVRITINRTPVNEADPQYLADMGKPSPPDVYPVGLLSDIKRHRVRYGLRYYVWRQIKARNWRAVRNHFRNGWLTEHRDPCWHNAGWGWTKRASARRADRECGKTTR